MSETKKRSIMKSFTWRIICIVVSIVTAYFLTGKFELSVTIGSVYNAITMVLYYIHERLWNILDWGKKKIYPLNTHM